MKEPQAPSPFSTTRDDSEARNAYRDYVDAREAVERAAQRWAEAESGRQQALVRYKAAYERAYGAKP